MSPTATNRTSPPGVTVAIKTAPASKPQKSANDKKRIMAQKPSAALHARRTAPSVRLL
jgi:hypothetical protein